MMDLTFSVYFFMSLFKGGNKINLRLEKSDNNQCIIYIFQKRKERKSIILFHVK